MAMQLTSRRSLSAETEEYVSARGATGLEVRLLTANAAAIVHENENCSNRFH